MATMEVRKCPQWRQAVTDLLLGADVGDTIKVQDYEMAAFARALICRRALGVMVLVDLPPMSELAALYGQDLDDFD